MNRKIAVFLASTCAVTGIVSAAAAADLPARMYTKAPAVAVEDPWTGFYVGLNAGAAWGHARATDINGWNVVGDTFSTHQADITGGGQIGYNWHFNNIVFGVEADGGYLGFRGSASTQRSVGVPFDTMVKADGGAFATARGRLGLVWGPSLIYVTGGYFGANVDARIEDALGATLFSNHTGFQSGWTVGGGLEYMIAAHWSAKVEYLHFDLGRERVLDPNHATFPFNIKTSGDLARLGLNYHF
jgi:outer membrane immunogenic protein